MKLTDQASSDGKIVYFSKDGVLFKKTTDEPVIQCSAAFWVRDLSSEWVICDEE